MEKKNKRKPSKEITKATVKVRVGEVNVYKAKEVNIPNVYHPNYKLIDETIEDIRKMSRKVCTLDYAANNVYLILQDALKKMTLAEK
tara:strand:+ start:239 stop:499 length:261 start_codon:yes stop_codon:yes gene_type:complete